MGIYTVDRSAIDDAAGTAIVSLREAASLIDRIAATLANIPIVDGVDNLTTRHEYTVDEAYRLRLVFETLKTKTDEMSSIMEIARALTGLR